MQPFQQFSVAQFFLFLLWKTALNCSSELQDEMMERSVSTLSIAIKILSLWSRTSDYHQLFEVDRTRLVITSAFY